MLRSAGVPDHSIQVVRSITRWIGLHRGGCSQPMAKGS